LKHVTGGGFFQGMRNLRGSNRWGATSKEMRMIFLFHKCRNLSGQEMFPVLGTPDKVIGSFVGDVFGVLCLHPRHCNMCSNPCEVPVRAALPLLEREGYPVARPMK
jgi:hypothetical protein